MSHKLSKTLAVVAMTGGLAGFGAAAATTVATAAPTSCSTYNVNGNWTGSQDNLQGGSLTMNLTQAQGSSSVGGSASYTLGASGTPVSGTVSGGITGNQIDVFISWADGGLGEYKGTVTSSELSGTTYDQHSSATAAWWVYGTANCATSTPTSKDQCKNGGWQSSTLVDASGNPFKNQGDCVSFVASGGKSDHS